MRRCVLFALASLLVGMSSLVVAAPASADKYRDWQWYLGFLRIAEAHQLSQGEGVTVAVVDSGVDGTHPDLGNNLLPGADLIGETTDGWLDTDGHGTRMAGLIASHGHGPDNSEGVLGIAPQAKVLPIRVPTEAGRPHDLTAEGIDEAVRRGAKIISVSQSSNADTVEAVSRALDAGVVIVAGAGNSPGHIFVAAPASLDGVLAVGAVRLDGNIDAVSTQGPELIAHLTRTATDKGEPGSDQAYGAGVVDPVRALTETPASITTSTTSETSEASTTTHRPGPTTEPEVATPRTDEGGGPDGGADNRVVAGAMAGAVSMAIAASVLYRRRHRPVPDIPAPQDPFGRTR